MIPTGDTVRSSSATPRVASHVAVAADGAGFMLVDVISERYYSLNSTGARVWELLARGDSLASVVDALATSYEIDRETCRMDVDILLRKLTEWGIVTWS